MCIQTDKCDLSLLGKVGLIMASMAELHISDTERAQQYDLPLGKRVDREYTLVYSVVMHLKPCCVICLLMYDG